MDTLLAGEHRGLKAGKLVVLPNNFPGSDRDVQCRFMDAMSLVAKYGRPDYFLTMTCNPYWPRSQNFCCLGRHLKIDQILWQGFTMPNSLIFMTF